MTSKSDDGTSGADLDEALCHAERALEVLDRTEARLRNLRLATSVALGAVLAGLILVLTVTIGALNGGEFDLTAIVAIVILLMPSAAVPGLFQVLRELRELRERDLSAVVELSRLVRDLLPTVVREERWSEFRRVMMRARIARFPISERSR